MVKSVIFVAISQAVSFVNHLVKNRSISRTGGARNGVLSLQPVTKMYIVHMTRRKPYIVVIALHYDNLDIYSRFKHNRDL